MDNNFVEREQHGDYRITIYQDDDPQNPLDDDNLGTLVHWHTRYDLGDRRAEEVEMDALRRGGWPLLARYLRATEGAVGLMPVSLLDHSGLHVWVGGGPHQSDTAGWDSGSVGFIYTTPERQEIIGTANEHVERCLTDEVETYDQYLRGDVYGYVVERIVSCDHGDEHVEHVDSCWGFYGSDMDYCKSEARAALPASVREGVTA